MDDRDQYVEDYYSRLKDKYPLDRLELEFERIEKLGYVVATADYQCQVWRGSRLIIDADFSDDFHENAASMIESFWHGG